MLNIFKKQQSISNDLSLNTNIINNSKTKHNELKDNVIKTDVIKTDVINNNEPTHTLNKLNYDEIKKRYEQKEYENIIYYPSSSKE